jgi:hypothetical protein
MEEERMSAGISHGQGKFSYAPYLSTSTDRAACRAFKAADANRLTIALFGLAETADGPLRQQLIDLGYCEGAKADVLGDLAGGRVSDARINLRCWQHMRRAIYGRRA